MPVHPAGMQLQGQLHLVCKGQGADGNHMSDLIPTEIPLEKSHWQSSKYNYKPPAQHDLYSLLSVVARAVKEFK